MITVNLTYDEATMLADVLLKYHIDHRPHPDHEKYVFVDKLKRKLDLEMYEKLRSSQR